MSLSFETISGYGPNGAVIHYAVEEGTARELGTDNLFLVVRHGVRTTKSEGRVRQSCPGELFALEIISIPAKTGAPSFISTKPPSRLSCLLVVDVQLRR